MSSNSATTTTSTDNGISLVEADGRGAEGAGGDDQLTINSLSSSLSSSTATTDTEGESVAGDGDGGRKRKKRRGDGSFSRGSSAKEIEEIDGEETAPEEAPTDALLDDETPSYAAKTRDRAIGRLITFSCILFTVPLTLMYFTYRFLFIGHYHLAHDRAILYAGIVAAATVYVLLGLFAWIAYRSRDETEFANQVAISGEGEGAKKTD